MKEWCTFHLICTCYFFHLICTWPAASHWRKRNIWKLPAFSTSSPIYFSNIQNIENKKNEWVEKRSIQKKKKKVPPPAHTPTYELSTPHTYLPPHAWRGHWTSLGVRNTKASEFWVQSVGTFGTSLSSNFTFDTSNNFLFYISWEIFASVLFHIVWSSNVCWTSLQSWLQMSGILIAREL